MSKSRQQEAGVWVRLVLLGVVTCGEKAHSMRQPPGTTPKGGVRAAGPAFQLHTHWAQLGNAGKGFGGATWPIFIAKSIRAENYRGRMRAYIGISARLSHWALDERTEVTE
jgi:hypothetical protein